ncbi:MAG: AMP-binding protein, partial [Myxococcales bacterium]|nr:AMP-binding protein [Myxococcales bacterium]
MQDVYPVPAEVAAAALVNEARYKEIYDRSVADPEGYWREQAERITWAKKPTKIRNVDFTGDVSIKWYEDGELNVAYNCIDRHLETRGDQVAFIFEGDNPEVSAHITYRQLADKVGRLSNVLKDMGVKKGDRIMIYMPMIPEACYAMLACARIGAVHSVVFGGFSPEAISGRIQDAGSKLVITADGGVRGGRHIPLKANVDEAIKKAGGDVQVLMFTHTGVDVNVEVGRDFDANGLMADASPDCPAEPMNAEDPLFILYTSGSTGKPKGVPIPHACLAGSTAARFAHYDRAPGRYLMLSSFAFDSS